MIFIVIVQDNEIEMQTQGAKTTTRQYKQDNIKYDVLYDE